MFARNVVQQRLSRTNCFFLSIKNERCNQTPTTSDESLSIYDSRIFGKIFRLKNSNAFFTKYSDKRNTCERRLVVEQMYEGLNGCFEKDYILPFWRQKWPIFTPFRHGAPHSRRRRGAGGGDFDLRAYRKPRTKERCTKQHLIASYKSSRSYLGHCFAQVN